MVGAVMVTVGFVVSGVMLLAVTVRETAVAVFPAASRATAESVCVPLVADVVFHDIEYGDVMSSAPRFALSSLNWTPVTPMLSDAVDETVMVPETVAPAAGAESETVGAVVSGTTTVWVVAETEPDCGETFAGVAPSTDATV